MHILTKVNSNKESLAYMSLVHPILEYGDAYWDLLRGKDKCVRLGAKESGKICKLTNELKWESLVQCRKILCICALYEVYPGELAWKVMGDRLQRPYYLSRADHDWKIRNRR
jgi:hypothetical protein